MKAPNITYKLRQSKSYPEIPQKVESFRWSEVPMIFSFKENSDPRLSLFPQRKLRTMK